MIVKSMHFNEFPLQMRVKPEHNYFSFDFMQKAHVWNWSKARESLPLLPKRCMVSVVSYRFISWMSWSYEDV